ncbi:MAG: circadian clock KaiB family protein [Alphaproteobacteria bacterium]
MTTDSTVQDGIEPRPGTPAATRLILFYAKGSPYSARAEAALWDVCAELPEGLVSFEALDVAANPRASIKHNIFVTPTLIRLEPEPVVRTTGPFDANSLRNIIYGSAITD